MIGQDINVDKSRSLEQSVHEFGGSDIPMQTYVDAFDCSSLLQNLRGGKGRLWIGFDSKPATGDEQRAPFHSCARDIAHQRQRCTAKDVVKQRVRHAQVFGIRQLKTHLA